MGEALSGQVFISYRRADTKHMAGRVFDRMEARFGAGNVFMDVDSIDPGLDFVEVLDNAVGRCDVLVALIGARWLDIMDDQGRRRLDNPEDFVALEIASALARGIRVIPVLIDGAAPPCQDDLPDTLAALARRQVVRLDHETFSADIGRLMTALDQILSTAQPDPEPQALALFKDQQALLKDQQVRFKDQQARFKAGIGKLMKPRGIAP